MMEYKGYSAKVEFDDEANIFHGALFRVFRGRATLSGYLYRE